MAMQRLYGKQDEMLQSVRPSVCPVTTVYDHTENRRSFKFFGHLMQVTSEQLGLS